MYWVFVVFHIVACLVLIGVILLQSGRGGGLSEMAGGQGAQQTQKLFGTQTNALLMKFTSYCAIAFLITSISLVMLTSRKSKSLMEGARIKPVFNTTKPDGKPMTKEELEAAVKAFAEQAKKEGIDVKTLQGEGAKLVEAAKAGATKTADAAKAGSAEAVKTVQETAAKTADAAKATADQAKAAGTAVTTAASNATVPAGEAKK